MAPPVRNIGSAAQGQITSTPTRVLNKLAIRVTRVRGALPVRGRGKR